MMESVKASYVTCTFFKLKFLISTRRVLALPIFGCFPDICSLNDQIRSQPGCLPTRKSRRIVVTAVVFVSPDNYSTTPHVQIRRKGTTSVVRLTTWHHSGRRPHQLAMDQVLGCRLLLLRELISNLRHLSIPQYFLRVLNLRRIKVSFLRINRKRLLHNNLPDLSRT